MPQLRCRAIVFLPLLAALCVPTGAGAATWASDFGLSDERKTEVSGDPDNDKPIENPTTETVKQSYAVSYSLEANPALQFKLGLKLDVTDEIKEGPKPGTDFDTYEIKPQVDFDVTARWWDLTTSWANDVKTTQDPTQDTTEDVTSDVEFNFQPAGDALPDLKAKYKRDFNKEGGAVQKVDTAWEGSLDYKFWDLLDLTVNGQRSYSDDLGPENQDKEDRKLGFDVSFDRSVGESLKVQAKWTNERTLSRAYSKDEMALDTTDDKLKNSVEGKGTYKPIEPVELSVDRKIEWNSDLLNVPVRVEVTDTITSTAKYDQSLTEAIDFSASYEDERKDTRGQPESDAYEINKGYSSAVDFTPLKNVKLSTSFDRTDNLKWPDNPKSRGETESHKVDDKWDFKADTSAWDDMVKLTVTRSLNATHEDGEKTADSGKWDLGFEIGFDTVPNLELSPKYTLTRDSDLLKDTTTQERKVEVGIKYEVKVGDVVTATLDHKYGRSAKQPADGKSTIARDDSTNLKLSWAEFFEGAKIEVDFTRSATDESEDDKGPIVDYTYGASLDWDFLKNYTFSFTYKYDRKQESQDNQTFKTSFSVDLLDGLLSLNLEHEFDEQLKDDSGRETKDTHRYLIELKGKF
ncbi:MAG: hypothetical protein HZB55_14455 [Deltaproteobacteria bacterium]|nr:hypothetical protein [Deltaproteobacteria bacterium]